MKIRMFRRMAAFAALVLLLGATQARAEWRRAESPNFILFSTLPEGQLRQRILLLEDFDRLLRTVTTVNDPPAPNKLRIYIVRNHQELTAIAPLGAGIVGFYTATPNGIAAFVDGSAEEGGNETLFHEYSHHFMMQYRPNAYPAWYVEGFAEYYMTARFTGHQVEFGNFSPGRIMSLVEGSWLPMDRILYGSPEALGETAMEQYYAQSWLAVHYFYSNIEREARLARYFAAARDNPRGALHAATGMNEVAFGQELRQYIARGRIAYRRMNRPEGAGPVPVTVTVLPAGANDLMLYEAKLHIGEGEAQGRADLPRIRAAAARHPNDPFAARVLAHAEARYGDPAVADRLLESLLAASPGDAELLYVKGLRYLAAAEHDQDVEANLRTARLWFGRAHQADGNHYQTLYRYAGTFRGDPGFASENNANVMLLAHQLAPQVAEITINAAALLIRRHDTALALSLLRPLAADPHNAQLAQAAQRMIERASQGAAAQNAPAQDPQATAAKPN